MVRIGSDILREVLETEALPEVWVRFPRQLGDVIFSLPFFINLQRQWNAVAAERSRSLRWIAVGHDIGAALFADAKPSFISECVIESGGQGKPDPWHLLRRWREQRPVAVINLSQSVRLILAAALTRVPIRAGIADNHLQLLYTHPFQYRDLPLHCAQRYAPLLGLLAGTCELQWEALTSDQFGGLRGLDKLKAAGWKGGAYVCMAYGTRGDAKRWMPEQETWPKLAKLFLQQGLEVVWLGSPGERVLGHELCERSPGSVDLTGLTTISEAFAIAQAAYGTVAIDTGLAHLSAGAGRPTVTINSHSPEVLIQPIGPASVMLSGPMMDIQPSQSRECSVASPSMLRLPQVRVANILHALAAETNGSLLSPRTP